MKINDIRNKITENAAPADAKYLISDGGQRYFIFTYPNTPGSNPRHLKAMLDDKATELDFKKRNVVAQWEGDINAVIAKAKDTMQSFEDRKKDFPSQYYGSVKKVEELEAAKDIMSNKDILEDTPLYDDVEDMTEIDDMDEPEEQTIEGTDVLRMAMSRGIISKAQYKDPEPILLDMATGMADMLSPDDVSGSSDVSILMKEFVATAKAELVLLLGPKVDSYYNMNEAGRDKKDRSPMSAINKFLNDKKSKEVGNSERGGRHRKDHDKPKTDLQELGESKRKRK